MILGMKKKHMLYVIIQWVAVIHSLVVLIWKRWYYLREYFT